MLKIFTYQDRSVLAGLTWGPSKPSGLLHRTPLAAMSLAATDLALHWDDRTALVPDEPEYIGKASLLSMLAGHLSEEELIGRVFCAFEIAEQAGSSTASAGLACKLERGALFFAAVLVNGKPAIGAERLFDTRAELISHIEAECSNGQIDRLAIDPYLAEDIAEDVTRRIAGCYLCSSAAGSSAASPTPNPVCVEGKPASRMPFGLAGWKIAAGAGASVLTLAAGILLWVSVQPSEPAISAPRIAAVQTTFRDESGFARNCLAAFAGIWPQAPGWQMTSEGCATPAMRDPALTGFAPALANADDPAHAVAYRIYQLRGGWDDAIARKAADAVYAESAVHMEIRGNRLVSSIEIAVPMLNAEIATDQSAATPEAAGSSAAPSQAQMSQAQVSLTPAELLAATEAVFLGLADSIVLDGRGNGNSTAISSPKVRVMLKSGFEDIFERVQRIEGAEIARLSRNGKTVTLEITTRQMIIVPLSRPLEHVMLRWLAGPTGPRNCRPNGACEKALPRQRMTRLSLSRPLGQGMTRLSVTGLKTAPGESAEKTPAARTRAATQARAADRGRAMPALAPETAVNTREDEII